jgi:hypothetical protein
MKLRESFVCTVLRNTQLVNSRIKVIKTFSLSHFRFSSDEERYYILTAYIGLLLEVAFMCCGRCALRQVIVCRREWLHMVVFFVLLIIALLMVIKLTICYSALSLCYR